MTREEAIERLTDFEELCECVSEDKEAVQMAIEALKVEPCEDCVSRQAIKQKKIRSEERHEWVIPVAEIDWLPSVKHMRPKGKWVKDTAYKCSICGKYGLEWGGRVVKSDFCPHCGADMRGEEE